MQPGGDGEGSRLGVGKKTILKDANQKGSETQRTKNIVGGLTKKRAPPRRWGTGKSGLTHAKPKKKPRIDIWEIE